MKKAGNYLLLISLLALAAILGVCRMVYLLGRNKTVSHLRRNRTLSKRNFRSFKAC